jgi:hypothetical protein
MFCCSGSSTDVVAPMPQTNLTHVSAAASLPALKEEDAKASAVGRDVLNSQPRHHSHHSHHRQHHRRSSTVTVESEVFLRTQSLKRDTPQQSEKRLHDAEFQAGYASNLLKKQESENRALLLRISELETVLKKKVDTDKVIGAELQKTHRMLLEKAEKLQKKVHQLAKCQKQMHSGSSSVKSNNVESKQVITQESASPPKTSQQVQKHLISRIKTLSSEIVNTVPDILSLVDVRPALTRRRTLIEM